MGRSVRCGVDALVASLDTSGLVLFDTGHRVWLNVGIQRAWLGRLVVLGSCGERVVYALARWGRIITLIGSYRKARRVQSLDDYVGDFHFCLEFIGYVFGTFGGYYLSSLICRRSHPRSVYLGDFGRGHRWRSGDVCVARLAFNPRKPLSAQIS